ncbi:hypothetical protein PFLUV_G00014320 [Perca fluviatilis]|uniref:C-type lectin domain-containing protein n=1 Tax=Perca fluviatilis TaxID=8168 RepID=A0A6A5FSS7_PERFL|nr:hypothetical protein PFLUV_G00014320 [Perca fluviatilis]
MKILLVLSVLLCAALSIRAATVVVAEAAAVPQENKPAPESVVVAEAAAVPQENKPASESEMDAAIDVADGRGPARHQARFDFCLDGWHSFRGNCYFLTNQAYSWSSAERLVKTGGHTFAWIGGYYFQGFWRWEDGSAFDYTNQGSMSSTSNCQCLRVNSQTSNGWSNNVCTLSYPFVCQIKTNC